MADLSKLRPFIGDDNEDGPDTVLVIKGFSGRAEIEHFMDGLMQLGLTKPREDLKQ